MIRHIHNLTSLDSLKRVGNPRGQIATLLILLTVVLLIFVMTTMNIGETAMMNTRIANAADAAVLSLASQLSTKARQLSDGLKNSGMKGASEFQACSRTGAAAIVISVVIAVVAIVIAIVSWGSAAGVSAGLFATAAQMSASTLVMAGAFYGAIGGAIGGYYVHGTGEAAIKGAITGAVIGATLGNMAGGWGGTATCSGGESGVTVAGGGVGGGETVVLGGAAKVGTAAGPVTLPAGTTITGIGGAGNALVTVPTQWGALAQGALTLTATGYTQSVEDKMAGEQIDMFTKMMQNMNEKDRMRESTFLTALSQVVDDPNMSADVLDTNRNKNISELVPDFQLWSFQRIAFFNSLVKNCLTPINCFFDTTRWTQAELLEICQGTDSWQEQDGGTVFTHDPGVLESEDFKIHTCPVTGEATIIDNAGNDGPVVKLLRGLEAGGYDISFWEPGPTAADMQAAQEACGEEACDPPPGFDKIDAFNQDIMEELNWLANLDNADKEERAETWGGWLDIFYDEFDTSAAPVSFYFLMGKYRGEIPAWRKEALNIINNQLPACVDNPAVPGEVLFWPCRIEQNSCTVTKEKKNVFPSFSSGLCYPDDYLELVNQEILKLYNALYNQPTPGGLTVKDLGGLNPVVYQWSDTRGAHQVKVGTGGFKVPNLQPTRYGNWWKGKKCMELRDYSDSGTNCKVTITRKDETRDLGTLGFWNPFAKGVTKTARAAYSYNFVELVD